MTDSREVPQVSFLVAAFNEENYLLECINSCLEQEGVSVEVCVVDDGSHDRTPEIIKELAGLDSRIKYSLFEKNKGKVSAFNEAYRLSSGRYVALVGADDVNLLSRSRLSVEAIEQKKVGLVYSDYFVCDEFLNIKRKAGVSSNVTLEQLCFNNKISGGTVFFDRVVAAAVFPIPSSLKFEDWWIAFVAVSQFKVAQLNEPVLYYRHHGLNDSISKSFYRSKLKDFSRHFAYYDAFRAYLNARGIDSDGINSALVESEYFKRVYVANDVFERLKLSLAFLKKRGLPRTSYGLAGMLIVSIFGSFPFDFAHFVKSRLR